MVNQHTLNAYKEAGVDYQLKGVDEHLKAEREKTSEDKNKQRKINSMYRFRTNESEEYLLYEQDIITTSNLTHNRIQWHEDMAETSMYSKPIVERQFRYDQETEKQSSDVRQIAAIETHYIIKFTEEEVNKLKPFTNLATKYYVWQQDGMIRTVTEEDDWLHIPFEILIAGPNKVDEYKAAQEEEEDDTKPNAEIVVEQSSPQTGTTKTKVSR